MAEYATFGYMRGAAPTEAPTANTIPLFDRYTQLIRGLLADRYQEDREMLIRLLKMSPDQLHQQMNLVYPNFMWCWFITLERLLWAANTKILLEENAALKQQLQNSSAEESASKTQTEPLLKSDEKERNGHKKRGRNQKKNRKELGTELLSGLAADFTTSLNLKSQPPCEFCCVPLDTVIPKKPQKYPD